MRRTYVIIGIVAAAVALWIPWPAADVPPAPTGGQPFVWDQDDLWESLESSFTSVRTAGCSQAESDTKHQFERVDALLSDLERRSVPAADSILTQLEQGLFFLAPHVAACPARLDEFVERYRRMRALVKHQSRHWDLGDRDARDRLYRLLYGGRAAVEEVVLQHPAEIPDILPGMDAPTSSPSTVVNGIRIASGDMLVSRGGYPTSALISRGSDYPGNFSHVAIAHVDETTGAVSVIEAHIEIGVAVATAEQYLQDKKLRILVLRPRADLSQLVADPLLPHKAATKALERAQSEHVPYDFAMDYSDATELFCSEVASSVYHDLGVDLWMGISTISAEGLRRWLASFGVRHFETQEPSDLEYDPQLVVVAEWRDPETLFDDHIDNAVIDAMLEGADRGDVLQYGWIELGPARLAKSYSVVMNMFGRTGLIPEGMGAASALRNQAFTVQHREIAASTRGAADRFREMNGYAPPYWELVRMARAALVESR